MGFPGARVVKSPPTNAGDRREVGLVPGSGRSPGAGNDNPVQYSCLENQMDRETWWATVHQVTDLDTTDQTHTHRNLVVLN